MIKKGDRVWIKPEFQDAGDDRFAWYAIEDEGNGRVAIRAEPNPLGTNAEFHPWTVVSVSYLVCAPCGQIAPPPKPS